MIFTLVDYIGQIQLAQPGRVAQPVCRMTGVLTICVARAKIGATVAFEWQRQLQSWLCKNDDG
jgi:hypothetical protein